MEVPDIIKSYEDNIIARVIVNAIPYIGGSVDVLLTQKWSRIQQKRINDLLDKIASELAEIKDTFITKAMLESEEFHDLVYSIANHAIASRCNEIRTACARIIKSAVTQEKSIFNLEDLLRQITDLQEKDIIYLRCIKEQYDSNEIVTGVSVSNRMSQFHYSPIDAEIQLYRFENLGLLDHPRNMLNGRGKMAFLKMPLFDELTSYLGI